MKKKRVLSRSPAEMIALGLLLLICPAAPACRDGKGPDNTNATSSPSLSASAAVALPSTSATVANEDIQDASASADEAAEVDAGVDAGTDRGKRKLRRLGSGADASAPASSGGVVSQAPPTPTAADAPAGKRGFKPMGDELPYGGAGASAAPVLEKKPFIKEDPWGTHLPP